MFDEKGSGGSAFPCEQHEDSNGLWNQTFDPGMSLRDYFAAKALVGILSGPCSRNGVPATEWFDIPEQAYRLADAMLKARLALTSREQE